MMTPDLSDSVNEAVSVLRHSGLVALPTDTLYALAARALDANAVRRVFDLKGREQSKPLPLFVADVAMAERFAFLDQRTRRLAERFWPGGLTIVVRKRPEFDSEALAGGDTVALRVPNHPIALAVIHRLDEPITATSANLSGGCGPDTPQEVRRQLGDKLDLIVDAGRCPVGVASTIVDGTSADLPILRQGAISEQQVREALSAEPRAI